MAAEMIAIGPVRPTGAGNSELSQLERIRRFERIVLPHLAAAYGLARWLVREPADAEDVVQDALIRALRYFDGFAGVAAKAWLLGIVRNAAYDWLHRNRPAFLSPLPEGEALDAALAVAGLVERETPESRLIEANTRVELARLVEDLPTAYREVLVLRDIEDLSYAEIAKVVGIPVGTVMSRLARARERLRRGWFSAEKEQRA